MKIIPMEEKYFSRFLLPTKSYSFPYLLLDPAASIVDIYALFHSRHSLTASKSLKRISDQIVLHN